MDVEVKVEGELGAITLSALQEILGNLNRLLKGMGQGEDWSLTGLDEGSALVAVRPLDRRDADVGRRLLSVVQGLEDRPEIPPFEDETTVRRLADLIGLVGRRGVAGLRLRTDLQAEWAGATTLTPAVRLHALQALNVKVRSRSTFRGRLDKVNLRSKTPQFSLYNEARKLALRCNTTDDEVIDQVKHHVGEVVVAKGDLSRNARNQPIHLRVDRLRVADTPHRQVSVTNWAGAAPFWTEGMSSVEFVRRQRRAGTGEGDE
ncbi:hypothetical protein [Streptomyces sp. NPDC048242]|uniref:hypothetical protein n=1 Tax=Streptomyces sp. NPDC048242 TaxID=3155026 RepID=UPI00342B142D